MNSAFLHKVKLIDIAANAQKTISVYRGNETKSNLIEYDFFYTKPFQASFTIYWIG